MNRRIFVLILSIMCFNILLSCSVGVYTQAPGYEFTSVLNDSAFKYKDELNFEGGYHFISSSSYNHGTDYKNGNPTRFVEIPYLDQPVFFFRNNLMCFDYSLTLDSSIFFKNMQDYGTQESAYINSWGTYTIKNKIITAIFYYPYTGGNIIGKGITQRLLTYFQGYLKNRDTIIGWHMIPPYPNIRVAPNQGEFDSFIEPRDLYFKKVPIDKLIDPRKAWINKYKTN